MKKSKICNQYGVTLVELLAVLVISGIIISLITSMLITTFKQKDITQSHIDLRQEANYVVTKLRTIIDPTISTYKLCYKDSKVYLDAAYNESLTSDKVKIKGIDGVLFSDDDVTELTETTTCIDFNPASPLVVTLTLVDENNKEFEINTVISRLAAKGTSTPPPTGGGSTPTNPGIIDSKEDFDDLNLENYIPINFSKNKCEFFGDSKTTDRVYAPTWATYCPVSKVHDGSLYINDNNDNNPYNPITIFSEINVDEHLISKESVRLDNSGKIVVGGSANFENSLEQYSNSSINIAENLFVTGQITLQNGAKLDVGGKAQIDNSIQQFTNSTITIDKDLLVKGTIKLENNAKIDVGGNAILEEKVTLNSSSIISIGGNLKTLKDLSLQNGAKLVVEGDAHFGGNINPQYGNGTICVKGNATFDKNPATNYKVVNTNVCGDDNGTIYVLNQ